MNKLYENTLNGPVLYIRHGQTYFNNRTMTKEEAQIQPIYLDCALNERGRLQAGEISTSLSGLKVKYVFCSPFLRCIETTYLALKDHPDKNNIRVVIHPLISESIHGVHDFSCNIKKKKLTFGEDSEIKFDWSVFDSIYPDEKSQETYFLDYVDNVDDNDNYLKELLENLKKNCTESDLVTLSAYYINKNKRMESLKHMFNRNIRFKTFLKDFLVNNDHDFDGEHKIVVITHSAFTKMSTSTSAYGMDVIETYPQDCYQMQNCEIITMFL